MGYVTALCLLNRFSNVRFRTLDWEVGMWKEAVLVFSKYPEGVSENHKNPSVRTLSLWAEI